MKKKRGKLLLLVGCILLIIILFLSLQKEQYLSHTDFHEMLESMLGSHFEEKHHEHLHEYLDQEGKLSTDAVQHTTMHTFMKDLLEGHFEEKHHEQLHKYLDGKKPMEKGMMEMIESQKETMLPGQFSSSQTMQQVKPSAIVSLNDGDVFKLSADIINKKINGKKHTMYGYNRQMPGPALKVQQASTTTVQFTNNLDYNTTVHWHGLRHENEDDGVPGVTQDPVQPGETYTYTVSFPDAGIYWYHPHIREDLQQDAGLAGNVLVTPLAEDYYTQVNGEALLVLDDILLDEKGIVPYGKKDANFALMGRFGNVMLVNGETQYKLAVTKGEIIRFYITNVANTRTFNLSFNGALIKLVGSDIGKYEKETFVESIIIAPAERYIIEVYFNEERDYIIKHSNPQTTYNLGSITVRNKVLAKDFSSQFTTPRINKDIVTGIDAFREYFDKPLDYSIDLTIKMPQMKMDMEEHREEKTIIEWEDTMKMMNKEMTSEEVTWILKDKATGKKNMDFAMKAKVEDKLKIRLFNDPKSMHPMQHPIHLHGQRFLVLSENGVRNNNLVWKDTVLVPKGSTVDILVDVTNPGKWMMHCHIAEHLEAGMMTLLQVAEDD